MKEEEHEYVSRPVKIKFKNNDTEIAGNIIFVGRQHSDWELTNLSSQFKFRFSDPLKEESHFNFWDVEMIKYL